MRLRCVDHDSVQIVELCVGKRSLRKLSVDMLSCLLEDALSVNHSPPELGLTRILSPSFVVINLVFRALGPSATAFFHFKRDCYNIKLKCKIRAN